MKTHKPHWGEHIEKSLGIAIGLATETEDVRFKHNNVTVEVSKGTSEREYQDRRIDELERLNFESREEWGELLMIIANVNLVRSEEGNSVTILCDDPEAEEKDRQAAVEVCGDFTEWKTVRFYGETWPEALAKAAYASRLFNQHRESDDEANDAT